VLVESPPESVDGPRYYKEEASISKRSQIKQIDAREGSEGLTQIAWRVVATRRHLLTGYTMTTPSRSQKITAFGSTSVSPNNTKDIVRKGNGMITARRQEPQADSVDTSNSSAAGRLGSGLSVLSQCH